MTEAAALASTEATQPDDDALTLYLVLIVLDKPFPPGESGPARAALTGSTLCAGAMVCNIEGSPLAPSDQLDRERCGLVAAQWWGEDGVDAMEAVLALIPREHPDLVGIECRAIDTVAGQW